jgi:dynein heavy chain, axonemal
LVLEYNAKKDELVMAQKLFNLEISTFKELVSIDEENKKLSVLYGLYREFKQDVKEWSVMLWAKLDSEVLRTGAEGYDKKRKKMGKEHEENIIFKKLATRIIEFKESIPLIIQLKSGSITTRHWDKLMAETGTKLEGNIKSLTLEQVFALNLQNFPEKVSEIVNEANQEHKNEEELSKIDQEWKTQSFELQLYKKGAEVRGWMLKNTEDIRQKLED